MEKGHSPVKRGISWTGHSTSTHGTMISCEENTDRSETHSWVKAKPLLNSTTGRPARKTSKNLLHFFVYFMGEIMPLELNTSLPDTCCESSNKVGLFRTKYEGNRNTDLNRGIFKKSNSFRGIYLSSWLCKVTYLIKLVCWNKSETAHQRGRAWLLC